MVHWNKLEKALEPECTITTMNYYYYMNDLVKHFNQKKHKSIKMM